MNRTKLKNYAPQARREFIQAMTDRAAFYGLTAKKIEPVVERGDVAVILGREFPLVVSKKRQKLVDRIKLDGFDQTIEALAYTWFNRFVAIRYMELHGYLEHGYRVLSHPEGNASPEILRHAEHVDLPGLKRETVIDLKLDGNKDAELYRMLLVAQCNALNSAMPFLFERIDDETELLLPDNLLHSDSLIRKLVSNLDAEDCECVEVLGWLYQFYICERKDQVMARKGAVATEDIPAVTQLFTPHWIVRYLVENSLGRLWLLNRPGSRLREHMPYYIEGAVSDAGGSPGETDFLEITKPEEIRVLDPAVGSGHMLTYAFDLLTLIYEEEGYAPTEIPALILRHNLHGLEICPRAAQLAELALVFKAREKSRRFFELEHLVRPHIIELRDLCFSESELRDYIHAVRLGDLFEQPMLKLLHQFEEAKNFGSLIQPCLDERAIASARLAIEANDLDGQLFLRETHLKVLRVLEQAGALTQRYHVVVANPPYMGSDSFNGRLKQFVETFYTDKRTDLFALFISQNSRLCLPGAYFGMITMHSWMFLASYEPLRREALMRWTVLNLLHLGARTFDSLPGEVVQAASFVVKTRRTEGGLSFCVRLLAGRSEAEKERAFLDASKSADSPLRFTFLASDLLKIPGNPIAYWLSQRSCTLLSGVSVSALGDTKRGLQPGNVPIFVRGWWEVSFDKFERDALTRSEALLSTKRWFKFDS